VIFRLKGIEISLNLVISSENEAKKSYFEHNLCFLNNF